MCVASAVFLFTVNLFVLLIIIIKKTKKLVHLISTSFDFTGDKCDKSLILASVKYEPPHREVPVVFI